MWAFLWPALLFCMAAPADAQHIQADLSFKIITDTNGARPAGMTDTLLSNLVDQANGWLADYHRGYRFRVCEITNIGSADTNGPSKWFGLEIRRWLDQLEDEAKADARYRWRTNAANIFIAQDYHSASNSPCWGGGKSHVPSVDIGRGSTALHITDEGWVLVHELGHHFDLYHTHDGVDYDTNNCTVLNMDTNKSDLVRDTIWDLPCTDSSNILAQINYGMNYLSLPDHQKKLVDDVLFNVMSYHFCVERNVVEDRMTEGQLDRWTDAANLFRRSEVTGQTRFVSLLGATNSTGLWSTFPQRYVTNAIEAARPAGGDIVLLRPGNYNERVTIRKPVTLRATRDGWATIGKP